MARHYAVFHPNHEEASHVPLVDERETGNLIVVAIKVDPLGINVGSLAAAAVDHDVAQPAVGTSLVASQYLVLGRSVQFLEGKAFRNQI